MPELNVAELIAKRYSTGGYLTGTDNQRQQYVGTITTTRVDGDDLLVTCIADVKQSRSELTGELTLRLGVANAKISTNAITDLFLIGDNRLRSIRLLSGH